MTETIDQEPQVARPVHDTLTDAQDATAKAPAQIGPEESAVNEAMPQAESPAVQTVTPKSQGKKKTTKPKQSTEGAWNRTWKPKEAEAELPAQSEPHWGIVPRVKPDLWEDRKGDIRFQGPLRQIESYDQAQQMYLRLTDQRCVPGGVKPRRKPVHYWYKAGGMLLDWDNSEALNDLNKGLKGAIRKNSKDPAWQADERTVLARICNENQNASIWDIAVQFNDEKYPLAASIAEEAGYPTGRTIESVVHEYRCYAPSYQAGLAPTKSTVKNTELAKLIQKRDEDEKNAKEAVKQAENEAKKAAREAKSAARNAERKIKPAANGEKKPSKKKSDDDKKATSKVSHASGVKKPPRFTKNPKKPMTKEQEDFADANAQTFLETLEAEEKVKAGQEEPLETAIATKEEPLLPVGGEQMPEITGELDAGDIRSSSPSDEATVASSPQDSHYPTADVVEQTQIAEMPEDGVAVLHTETTQVADEPSSDIVVETQPVTISETTVIEPQTTVETQVVSAPSQLEAAPVAQQPLEAAQATVTQIVVEEKFVEMSARDMEIDEDYEDNGLF
ncbi:hypothetical protein E8E11_004319 [Didymella keratinophila]|nr:hypothetical protein E8E11_004319 [Didymella keratinophila]